MRIVVLLNFFTTLFVTSKMTSKSPSARECKCQSVFWGEHALDTACSDLTAAWRAFQLLAILQPGGQVVFCASWVIVPPSKWKVTVITSKVHVHLLQHNNVILFSTNLSGCMGARLQYFILLYTVASFYNPIGQVLWNTSHTWTWFLKATIEHDFCNWQQL